ncbi:MAG: hypothetical protein ACM3U2_18650 [Deltaproteobacteria bacterium]
MLGKQSIERQAHAFGGLQQIEPRFFFGKLERPFLAKFALQCGFHHVAVPCKSLPTGQ